MGRISGLKSKMSAGRINPGKYQMTNTRWEEKEARSGTPIINFCQTLIDTAGGEHELTLFAMSTTAYGSDERNVQINKKGQLTTVDPEADVRINRNMGAGKYLDSLNDAGFSPKKLDNIDIEPSGLDGQWVVIDTPPSGRSDDKGNPYTDIVVTELIDAPKGSSKVSGKKTAAKPAPVEDEDDEEEEESDDDSNDDEDSDDDEDDDNDLDASEDEIDAAVEFVKAAIADPDTYVKNFDAEDNNGGITLKQANTAVFSKFKGKGALKGKVATLVGNPKFHQEHGDGWTFDADEGVITPKKVKKATKK